MATFHFNKLVRDKIIDHQINDGIKPNFIKLDRTKHIKALIDKLKEEIEEVEQASYEDLASEIADVQQVIDDLTELCQLSKDEIIKLQTDKELLNGSFKKGIYVSSVEVEEGNQWLDYYRQKYKET